MTGNDQVPRSAGVVPLRTILRNFLNLVESCEAGSNDGNSVYETEFQELKQFSESLKTDPAYLCKEGEKTANRKKNRYKDILPYDYTRVILGDYGDVPGSDYINANFIKGASGSSAYIACQGPLPHTVNDFWRMVVECEVQVIVMACNEQESGKHKCENYWVEEEGVERQFGQVKISLKKCRQVCPDFLVRTMKIRYLTPKGETEERSVCQFHYSAWPDHGVPSKVRPLLDMVRLIRDCQTSETLPVLVHCSAGCGRTGTICAIDYVWGLLRLGKLTSDFSLFHLVREMRRQRIAMVQTKDQYILVHRAVKELFEEQLKIIDSHPYANVDEYGLPIDIKRVIDEDEEEPTYETVEYNPSHQYLSSASLAPISTDNHSSKSKWYDQHKSSEQQKLDDITVLSSDGEEDNNKQPASKSATHTRNALLRKPSIVKLKSFFEKSKPKDKKKSSSGGTNLSRAKSDVSSRFYAFTNSIPSAFHSRMNPTEKSSSKLLEKTDTEKYVPDNYKPPLLAKPALPVKRSKSLKLDNPPPSINLNLRKTSKASISDEVSLKQSPSFSSINNVAINPIQVCIKQVEIPEMKKAVSKSVKQEIQVATTHQELSKKSGNNSFTTIVTSENKPTIPPKSSQVVVKSSSPSRIKMGVAKEMEDVVDFGRSSGNKNYENVKKYDTVVIKGPASNKRTSLTRSQSHVWQPSSSSSGSSSGPQIVPCRIFSDENIRQKPEDLSISQASFGLPIIPTPTPTKQNTSQGSGGGVTERRTGSLDEGSSKFQKQSSSSENETNNFQPIKLPSSDQCPVIRRRVPKTNPYANHIPGSTQSGSSSSNTNTSSSSSSSQHSPGTKRLEISKVVSPNITSTNLYQNIVPDTKAPKDLPQLKLSYSRSRENSSESSSNTATPRSSLPGTPTQTIDSTYAQIMKTNLHGMTSFGKNGNRSGTNIGIPPPPKSILKGSLSSTPSESDERLDIVGGRQTNSPSHQIKPSTKPNSNNNNTIITPPQKINAIRMTMGVRERRNSFRQAVCKEEPPHSDSIQESPLNPFLFSNGVQTRAQEPPRICKDYEPIWPDHGGNSYMNRVPLKPQINSNVPAKYTNSIATSNGMQQQQRVAYGRTRSQSEERILSPLVSQQLPPLNINPEQQKQPGLKVNEIKMLHDLAAPFAVSQTQAKIASATTTANVSTTKGQQGSGLRHQSSLRLTSSRPQQYPQGLSCFTFKKPSSLESINDPFHYDLKATKQNGIEVVDKEPQRVNGYTAPTKYNNYEPIHQYSSVAASIFPRMEIHNSHISENGVPVAPPRTRRTQQKMSSSSSSNANNIGDSNSNFPATSSSSLSSSWSTSNGAKNLPEIVRCSESEGQNANPNSPKHIIKALGVFQAKAANMRSRFSQWSDGREKKSPEKVYSSEEMRDEVDGGFVASSSTTPLYQTPASRSKSSKQQYL